jgi:energy-coupling factor transport system ATP-binding protein
VGIAFQYPEDQIFERTVFDEVAFGPRNLGLRDTELEARVRWALEMVGLDAAAVEGRVPFTLSGGETRRVALASILAMQPEVLVLDEPTAGLDPRGRHELLDRVQAWHAETGLTLIMVSHDLDALARITERVLLLYDGKVVADAPVREVLSDGSRLRGAGLSLPEPVALLQMLCRAGWAVRTDRLEPEEAAAEIARCARPRFPEILSNSREA